MAGSLPIVTTIRGDILSSSRVVTHSPQNMLYWNHFRYRDMWVLQLNDPPFNTLRLRHWEELHTLLQIFEREANQSSIPLGLVLAGSKKMFSVGDEDRSGGRNDNLSVSLRAVRESTTTLLRNLADKLPVVAALSGYTEGEAWDLATQCSYRVMGDNARIALSSNTPYITAQEAQNRSLVEELVGPDYVLARAQEWVTEQLERNLGDV